MENFLNYAGFALMIFALLSGWALVKIAETQKLKQIAKMQKAAIDAGQDFTLRV